jgi:DNA-directed RNA polymerase specialized sigma24 family protein
MQQPVKSVTQWLVDLKLGDSRAAEEIWDRFFERLCGRLRHRVAAGQRLVDEEDLAISAIHALYAGAKDGRFQKLDSREDLWQLLVLIGSRKAVSAHRAARARQQLGESALGVSPSLALGLDRVMAADVDDTYLDDLGSTCGELLESLEPRFRELALLKLEGFSNDEIAKKTGRSVRTIERHLMIIRESWKSEP